MPNSIIPPYKDTNLSFEERARDLVSRMTVEEKVQQMLHDAPAIERLGVGAYTWWNECLHGVARGGTATVFPQAIGLAATWDTKLMSEIAKVISDEARAKHHEFMRQGDTGMYKGLTYWSPNINIFRDPRWGRGQETYGEDPYLTSRFGVEFVKGLQGDDPKYLKLAATPKHYAVHSGPESSRHTFDAIVSKKDMYETYLYAFKACVQEAKAASIMGAYNRVNGEPSCASKTLLQDILRDEWGFDGYVVSDCGAIQDLHTGHKVTTCTAESAAMGVKNGLDLECGCVYANLLVALERGLVTESDLDICLVRLFTARFRLGMFDPPEDVPYSSIPYEINNCPDHRKLALQTARESIVLLKNAGDLLPLKKSINSIAVIGPNATHADALLGNYNGTPSSLITPLQGIQNKAGDEIKVIYAKGCEHVTDAPLGVPDGHGFSEAVAAAKLTDVAVMFLGLNPRLEGEEGDAFNSEASGDRVSIDLPQLQQRLLESVCAVGKPVVLVILSGSAIAINWAADNVPAIVQAWYPGEEGGNAIADVLFGDHNPSGRLPVTYVRSLDDLPDFEEYAMAGRTYRYMQTTPLYPFGFGLSYTSFEYSNLTLSSECTRPGDSLEVSATVTNTGDVSGKEIVQLYLSDLEASVQVPLRRLIGFQAISLAAGESSIVSFTVTQELMNIVDETGKSVFEPGRFCITIGGNQGDARSLELGGKATLAAEFSAE